MTGLSEPNFRELQGLISGSSYLLNGHYHQVVREGADGMQVQAFPDTYVQISRDGTPNYIAHDTQSCVVTPEGIPVLDKVNDGFVRCVG